jgi:hypothetical protein
LQGVPSSSSRGGHNKKLCLVQDTILKDYLVIYYNIGRGANLQRIIAAANSILRCDGQIPNATKRWAKRWITRYSDFLKTLREKPLSAKRRATHNREDIEKHFQEYRRYRDKWGVLDDDIYNFDETGYQIGVTARDMVIIPIGIEAVYVDNPENRELVTSIEYIRASGYHIPAIITFKGAYYLRKYFKNDIEDDILWIRSDSGFVNKRLTFRWL